MRRIPAIDGLRTLAVMSVIALHSGWGVAGGYLGVDVFFVLSGFLITTVLLREQERAGRISIGKFYWHRFVRLAPASLFAATSYLIAAAVFFPDAFTKHLWEALQAVTYVMNINLIRWWGSTGYLNHTWSLAIEEQFYLIWAPLAAAALVFFGRRGVFVSAAFGIVIVASWRFSFSADADTDLAFWRVYHGFDTRCDELLVGCLLAASYSPKLGDIASRTWLFPFAFLAYGIMSFGDVKQFVLSPFGLLSIALASAWLIAGLASERSNLLGKVLSMRPFVYIGALSYAMYLWNWLLIKLLTDLQVENAQNIAFVGTMIAAAISYHFVEVPARSLRAWNPFSKLSTA